MTYIKHLPNRYEWNGHFGNVKILHSLLEEAKRHPGVARMKLACCIMHNKRPIAIGINSYKTSPLQLKYRANPYNVYMHAEIEALARATRVKQHLLGCSAYIVRVNKLGDPAMAKPCEGCMSALLAFGVEEIYHT